MSDIRQAIVAAALRWEGTPYHHRARVLGVGCDCLMLIVDAYQAVGLLPADLVVPDYPRDIMFHTDDSRYLDGVLQHCHEVEQPLPGDLVMWQYGRTWSHGGIVLDWPRIIHAYAPLSHVTVMRVQDDSRLLRRKARFFSPKGI